MSDAVGSETTVYAAFTRQPGGSVPACDGMAQVRNWRAGGVGPSCSGTRLAGGRAGLPAPGDRPYRPTSRSTAVALAAMMALGIVAVHSTFRGYGETRRLADFEQAEQKIIEHNQARNLLIQHLAKEKEGKIAHLRGYAERIGELEAEPRSVMIFTPAEPNAKPEVAELPALRKRIEDDLERFETWTPPPLLEEHEDMTFTAGELAASRAPTAAALAVAAVALMIWSIAMLTNLPALRASTVVKPSRALFWWLIPGLNLYLPFIMLRDIWQGSDATSLTSPQRLRIPVVSLWWLTALGALGFLGFATYHLVTAQGVFLMARAVRLAFWADIGVAALAAVTFVIIAAASWNQALRHDFVVNLEAKLGPATARRHED